MANLKFSESHRRLLKEYISGLLNLYGDRVRSVCLFGSLARGEAGPESDVDVLAVVDGLPEDAGSRYEETSGLRMELRRTEAYNKLKRDGKPRLISEVYLTPDEVEKHPPILLDVVEDGIILYDKGGS